MEDDNINLLKFGPSSYYMEYEWASPVIETGDLDWGKVHHEEGRKVKEGVKRELPGSTNLRDLTKPFLG